MNAIDIDSVFKSYDGLPVLRGVDLHIAPGEVYGLLGPNGAGKSTLLHLLLGFLRPDSGTLRLLGTADLEQVRSRIGYLPERLRYHTRYTAREYLRFLGQFSGMGGAPLKSRIEEELRTVGLLDAADRMLSTYSKGMLQRLGIAQALLADPELLLIDEPTSGLDPAGQREMLDLLAEVRGRGHTIFLTTHFLGEIDTLCDRAGILFGGQLAAEVDVALLRAPGRNVAITVGRMPEPLAETLQRISPSVRYQSGILTLHPNTPALQAQVLRTLLDAEIPIISLEPHARPLEDLYLRIVRGETPDLPTAAAMPHDLPAHIAPAALPDDPGRTLVLEDDYSIFAPPGHPDAQPQAAPPATPAESAPPEPPAAQPGRPGSGDTLLRELLRREDQSET